MDPVKASHQATVARSIAPLLQRVLIVDPDEELARTLAALLRSIALCQVWTAADMAGLDLAGEMLPTLVFVEQSAGLEGGEFVRRFRRSPSAGRKAVAIMMTSTPTVGAIIGARDCGAHEVLRKPFARPDLIRRLELAALEPRDWIEAETYVGPDRRRFASGDCATVVSGRDIAA